MTAKPAQEPPRTVDAQFVGGPRDGETMRLCSPPPPTLRVPVWGERGVWCHYVLSPGPGPVTYVPAKVEP